jgi:tetratricopeptide (TPR) repeat protein
VTQDVSAERDGRFDAWIDALVALSPAGLWIIEDVHWASSDLLAFLDVAAGRDQPIVCTARPSLLDTAADWVAGAAQLDLATLPTTSAAELVRALVGDSLPAALVTAIADRSDGNPLFIEELLRTWVSVGTLSREDGGWRLTVEPGAVTLPATVQAIYAAQLDDLPGDARQVARRASVAGRRFADAALEPLEIAGLRDGLDVLRRRAFVAGPYADPLSGDVYAYRHALLRDAGYASLARVERARLHAALASWLEQTAGDRVTDVAQLIAEHYAAAAESVPAIGTTEGLARPALSRAAADWFERAASAAVAMAAPASAVRLFDRSIELTETDAPADVARRRLRRGAVLADTAELDAGIDDMAAALDVFGADLSTSHALFAEAAYRLALAYMQQIRFPEAEHLSADAVRRLDREEEPAGTARLMGLHAWSVAAQGRDEGAIDESLRARAIGASLGDPGLEVDLLEHYSATADELDMLDPAVWDELEELARAAGRWRQVVIALRVRGMLRLDVDPSSALPLIQESAELAEAHGFTEQRGWAELARAEVLFVSGDWDESLAAADRAIGLGERYAYERLVFRTWMVVLPLLADRRDPSWIPRFERWWGGAVSHFPPSPSPYGTVLAAARQLWIARARGEALGGDVSLPDDIPPFLNPHFLAAREIITEALIDRGEFDRAAIVVGQEPDHDWTPLMRASHSLMSSWLATARGEPERARHLASQAATHARSVGARWWLERALGLA